MDLIENSCLELENFDWWEAAKYVFVMLSPEEIADNDLTDVLPRRVNESRVKLTVKCLKDKDNDNDWIRGNTPTDTQAR